MNILSLWGKYEGSNVYIVGKGPSLQRLNKSHFGSGVVITLNSAIEKVEKLGLPNDIYSMQKDRICSSVLPTTKLLLHRHESAINAKVNGFIFDNIRLGLKVIDFSAISAIRIAQKMGCKNFYFVCFDACTNGDLGVWNGDQNPCYSLNYKEQAMAMIPYLRTIKYKWITP